MTTCGAEASKQVWDEGRAVGWGLTLCPEMSLNTLEWGGGPEAYFTETLALEALGKQRSAMFKLAPSREVCDFGKVTQSQTGS